MPCSVVLAATIFTPSINGTARRPGSLGKDPPGAPLISLSPAPPIQGQHSQPRQKQHRSNVAPSGKEDRVNIIQGMHLSRMRIVLIAVVLAIAGLLVSASQIGPAGAATAHAGGLDWQKARPSAPGAWHPV
jgi:hypothetical protein